MIQFVNKIYIRKTAFIIIIMVQSPARYTKPNKRVLKKVMTQKEQKLRNEISFKDIKIELFQLVEKKSTTFYSGKMLDISFLCLTHQTVCLRNNILFFPFCFHPRHDMMVWQRKDIYHLQLQDLARKSLIILTNLFQITGQKICR